MLLSIFSTFYEITTGENSNVPEYQDGIFDLVGIFTLVLSIVMCLVFYVALGRWRQVWYRGIHWVITLILVALFAFGFAFVYSKSVIGSSDGYMFGFSFVNALYASIYYFGFSFLFKKFSIFSKHTPF